ncbi:M50 family metallopeptidase [Anaeromyxobacter oryzae]|uniref:RIP metalloprotease RseP n=1 Tax=Anaeromyxobacter oryzae TaxID=2918170 RepID=A0ABM7WRB1_9BACT|nr:M50 family metallopeptidase [Anaeromyxobacter oryzae]BDG02000.1 RIP metalloprotease RseP [Anaeromyxobacter oryzae]
MTTPLAIVAAVLAISLLIIIHEAGHHLAARAFGMRVERFSVGFGPVLLRTRRSGTEFALSALPFGGYVKIAGMAPGEDVPETDAGAFANHPAWRRFLVILAGPAMNYVAAIAIAAACLVSVGLPDGDPSARIGALTPGMPAEKAGLAPGDRIVSVDGTPVATWLELVGQLQRRPGRTFPLEIERGEGAAAQRLTIPITPVDQSGIGRVGFRQHQILARSTSLGALHEAFDRTNGNIALQLKGFGAMFSGAQKPDVTGPVGIGKDLVRSAHEGKPAFLSLVWTISVVLAILNLFPIPALDGGRLVFLAYEIVTRRRANAKLEGVVNLVGAVALFALILGVTLFKDILGR